MKKLLFLLLAVPFLVQDIDAQSVLNRLEDRAKRKVNERIEKKVDEKIDQELDKILEEDSTSTQTKDTTSTPKPKSGIFGGKADCKVENSYTFQSEMLVEVYSVGKKKKDSFSMSYYQYFEKIGLNFGMKIHYMSNQKGDKMPDMSMVFNLKDSCLISLTETNNMKMGFKMSTKDKGKTSTDEKPIVPTKTGKTKTILGRTCYEFIGEDEKHHQQYWVSEKDLSLWDAYSKNGYNQTPTSNNGPSLNMKNGFPLEMVHTNKKEGTTMYFFVREINTNVSRTISTEGYTFW